MITELEVTELNPDMIVECYLDAKHYDYDPTELDILTSVPQTCKSAQAASPSSMDTSGPPPCSRSFLASLP